MILNLVILSLVTAERLVELPFASRNTRRLLDRGAKEYAPGHYPLIVALHALWLAALWWLAPGRPIDAPFLLLFVIVELARVWVLASLGARWTTRIIVLKGAPLVRKGPYRYLDHPNYMVVAAEIALLPMVFGLWRTAIVFSLVNALLLAIRIREENRALAEAHLG